MLRFFSFGRVLVVFGFIFGLTGLIGPSFEVLATVIEYCDLGVFARLNSRGVVSVMPFAFRLKLLTWPALLLCSMPVVIEGMNTEAAASPLIFMPACLCNEVGTMSFELAKTSRFDHAAFVTVCGVGP